MAVIAFKRIGKEPPKPVAVVAPKLPTRAEVAKMTAEEAYRAGEKFGEAILNAKKTPEEFVVVPTTPKPAPASSKLTDQVTTLFKKSDTGIGHKQWSIYVRNGNSVVVEWGHCNKSKQEKVYPFVNRPHLMETWMREAIMGKMKKGYSRTK